MIPDVRVTVEVDAQSAYDTLGRLRRLPKTAMERMQEAVENLRLVLATPRRGSRSPVRWASDRQKLAYFYTDGFTHPIGWERPHYYHNANLHYARTGLFEESWNTVQSITDEAQTLTLENYSPYAYYVTGDLSNDSQELMHQGVWWDLASRVVQMMKNLPETVRATLLNYYESGNE